MKERILWVGLLVCLISKTVLGQTIVEVFKIPAYTTFSRASWNSNVYQYPVFEVGKILVANGHAPGRNERMNVNLFTETVEMITANGDTLAIADAEQISGLKIGENILYRDSRKGFIEILGDGPIYLGVNYRFTVVMENSAGEKFEITDMRNTTSRYDRFYKKIATYFFMDSSYHLTPAVSPSIKKLFPSRKQSIYRYIEEHHISFKRREDLLELLDYCNGRELQDR